MFRTGAKIYLRKKNDIGVRCTLSLSSGLLSSCRYFFCSLHSKQAILVNMKLGFKVTLHVACLTILILFTYPNIVFINFMLSDFLFSWITAVDYWGTSTATGWIFGQNQVLFCGVQHIHPFCKSTELSCFWNPASCCTKALWWKYLEYWNGKEKSVFEKAD